MRSSPRLAPCGDVLTCSSSPGASALCRILLVQRDVELQDVDGRFAEEPEPAPVRVVGDGLANQIDGDAAGRGDPVDLQIRVGDRDVRVEAATAGGDGVGGHRGVGRCAAADRYDLADAV